MSDLANLEKAFEAINKNGVIAIPNHTCCQTCGCHAIATKHGEFAPYVFWHGQDDEFAFGERTVTTEEEITEWNDEMDGYEVIGYEEIEEENPNFDGTMTGSLYLAHGNLTERQKDMIVNEIRKTGLVVEWDRSEYTRILVKPE